MSQRSYVAAIVPAIVGVFTGLLLSTAAPGNGLLNQAYIGLPEYHLWRVVIIAQTGVFLSVASYLSLARDTADLPLVRAREKALTALFAAAVVFAPTLAFDPGVPPLQHQRERMLIVVGLGLVAMVLVLFRVSRIHAAFAAALDADRHTELRRSARDMLAVGGLVVTLATLGSGVFQISLAAMEQAPALQYDSPMAIEHVIAYGGYFAVLLFLFFAPVLVAEREAAHRIAGVYAGADRADLETRLGLQAPLAEHMRSAFSVLSPLLGALATRLIA